MATWGVSCSGRSAAEQLHEVKRPHRPRARTPRLTTPGQCTAVFCVVSALVRLLVRHKFVLEALRTRLKHDMPADFSTEKMLPSLSTTRCFQLKSRRAYHLSSPVPNFIRFALDTHAKGTFATAAPAAAEPILSRTPRKARKAAVWCPSSWIQVLEG